MMADSMPELKTLTTVDASQTLSSPVDLHVTAANNAMASGATINITNEDARLYFDNIRPSDLLSGYSNNIRIAGAAINPDVNARVSVWRHGTVILPHAADYTPMQAFTGEKFTKKSEKFATELYYSNAPAEAVADENRAPLTLDNSIQSFKLKRGYMATLATNPDGTGYSRCFIAENEDISLEKLPAELAGKVSFVRVFPWFKASKKGWVGGNKKVDPPEGYLDDQADITRSTWVYCWSTNADWCRTPEARGTTWRNQEFVPEKWGAGGTSDWTKLLNSHNTPHLLSYNEPDHSEQSNVSVSTAIAEWPKHLQTGMRLGSPATTDFSWLYNFLDECDKRNYRVDYVAIHAYWGGSGSSVQCSSVRDWYNALKEVHERSGRPIWITEWNNGANWTHEGWPSDDAARKEKQRAFIEEVLAMMDTCSFIERYSLYNWVEEKRSLFWGSLDLTPAGEEYANFDAATAFSPNEEVIPEWNINSAPALTVALDSDSRVNLSWTDENLEQVDGYTVERAIGTGNYETIATTDYGTTTYSDGPLDNAMTNGNDVTYRVSSMLNNSIAQSSNETGFGTLAYREDEPAVSRLTMGKGMTPHVFNSTDNSAVIISGVQTYAMKSPMLPRITDVNVGNCNFGLSSWNYNQSDAFVSRDTVGVMLFPEPGSYNLDGITALAGKATEVTGEMRHITFEKPFVTTPVVLANTVTSRGATPAVACVSNVTTEGFDLQIEYEQASQGNDTTEDVDFVALTTGIGTLNGRTIAVGYTSEPIAACDSRSACLINYGTTLPQATLFGSYQTRNDNTVALPRAVWMSGAGASVFKNRETSFSASAPAADILGWCAVANDATSKIAGPLADNARLVYDKKMAEISRTDNTIMHKISVYSIDGRCMINSSDTDSISVAALPNGIYLAECNNSRLKFAR